MVLTLPIMKGDSKLQEIKDNQTILIYRDKQELDNYIITCANPYICH